MTSDQHRVSTDLPDTLDLFIEEALRDLERESPEDWDAADPAVAPLSVRDATGDVLVSLARVPASRAGHHPASWPPPVWTAPPLSDIHVIASPPVAAADLSFVSTAVSPDMEHRVLEVMGVTAPQLFAVSWPRAVARVETSGPTPYLVYFRPTVGQNAARGYYVGPGLGSYPFGWDYLFYGLWRYVNYTGDPLAADPYAKGLPYQIAAADRNAVLVVPLNRHPGELGVFLDAGWMQRILTEIQAFMFKEAGVDAAPPVGRTALAAFSSGNSLVDQFLNNRVNRRHPFYLDTLRELYMFDAPGSAVSSWVAQAARWAAAGSRSDKMMRIYTRRPDASYRALLGESVPTRGPFVRDAADGRLATIAVLPDAAWSRATAARGAVRPTTWQEAHQLISATMLTDALRRSGF